MAFSPLIPPTFLEPTRAGAVGQSPGREPGFRDAGLRAVTLRKRSGQRSGHGQFPNQPQDPRVAKGAPSHASFTQVASEEPQHRLSHLRLPSTHGSWICQSSVSHRTGSHAQVTEAYCRAETFRFFISLPCEVT